MKKRIANKLTPEKVQMTVTIASCMQSMCHKCPHAKRESHFCMSLSVPDTEKVECKACLEAQRKKIFGGAVNGNDGRNV